MWKFLFDGLNKTAQSDSNGSAEPGIIPSQGSPQDVEGDAVKVLKKGLAMRVIFFYPGEEGTYVDNAQVILYENGIVHIRSNQEETTTHLQNCEILWNFELDAADAPNKVRLLKPKAGPAQEVRAVTASEEGEGKPPKNPDLI
jgi:hypothetical protein